MSAAIFLKLGLDLVGVLKVEGKSRQLVVVADDAEPSN